MEKHGDLTTDLEKEISDVCIILVVSLLSKYNYHKKENFIQYFTLLWVFFSLG